MSQSADNDPPMLCDWPGCTLPASALVANDAPLTSSEYAERYACRWHQRNSTFPSVKPHP